MRKSKKFISLPIISLEEGQKIGVIKDIIINPNRKELAALLVEQRGWFKEQKIIPYTKVHSAGVDALTIEKAGNVDKAANFPEIISLIKDKFNLVGARVVTETGVILGQVEEFWIEELSGKIIALDITGTLLNSILKGKGQLSIEHIRTIGKDVLIACEGAEEHIINLEGGLQDKVKTIAEVTGQLLNTTWQKTLELSKNISGEKETSSSEKNSDQELSTPDTPTEELLESTPAVDLKAELVDESKVIGDQPIVEQIDPETDITEVEPEKNTETKITDSAPLTAIDAQASIVEEPQQPS